MKLFLSLLLLTISSNSFALESEKISEYTKKFTELFYANSDETTTLKSAKYQAFDKATNSLVYKVDYEYYEEWECASAPTPSGDACGGVGEPIKSCVYFNYYPKNNSTDTNLVSCDWPLSTVTDVTKDTKWMAAPYLTSLIDQLKKDITLEYILNFKTPEYITNYENQDGTDVHVYKAVLHFPVYDNLGSGSPDGQQEASAPPTSFTEECKYIKYDHVENDYEYAGNCELSIEDVIGEKLIDEL